MENLEKKEPEIDNLEVAELEDEDLDHVAGGDNRCPITMNGTCGES